MPYCGWEGYISNCKHPRSLHLCLHSKSICINFIRQRPTSSSQSETFLLFFLILFFVKISKWNFRIFPSIGLPFCCHREFVKTLDSYALEYSSNRNDIENFSSYIYCLFMSTKLHYRIKSREIRSTELTL